MNYFLNGFELIFDSFTKDPGVWWFLAPILILWLATQIYFGEYKREKISFAGAFSAGISFLWINISTLRILFIIKPDDILIRIYILVIFLFYGLFIIYNAYSHKVSREFVGTLASPNTLYPLSITIILFGQGHLKISLWAIFDLLIILGFIWLFFLFLKKNFLGLGGDIEAVKAGELPKELEEDKIKALK
ncbi:MAG: hypothetical protein COV69_03945 [Parcubacteria group bacterium CG11_big_fil_rev_8_21_14_0_20_39_14]|nr:MAG: hypothetical protein COV69_03945 [Parcubacteria group bacterium CG11_big_fil_rev_8_21_14_0_20_39_14]PIS35754.1 MAG: hypothetical protein COT36_00810 [Parcubacteria group bacterium CG08_land_8_20_14_0_20_38_56]